MGTEFSIAWDGTTLGDDGPYSAYHWDERARKSFGFGADNVYRGVFRGVGSELKVQATSPTTSTVNVMPGSAIINGVFYTNDILAANTPNNLVIAANGSGLTRIDVIVIRAVYPASQTVRLAVLQGTPGAGVPALATTTFWSAGTQEIPLAYITLPNGFATITDAMITDWRNYANLPNAVAVAAVNNTAGALESGTVVKWQYGVGNTVDTTTDPNNADVAGVVEARMISGGPGRVITQGLYEVILDGAYAAGTLLFPSTTAGQATGFISSQVSPTYFARSLSATTGAGQKCIAFINSQMGRVQARCAVYQTVAQALTAGVWNSLNYDSEYYDTNGMHSTVLNPNRVTINTSGNYTFSSFAKGDVGGNFDVRILLNGAVILARGYMNNFAQAACSGNFHLSSGQYIEFQVNPAANQNTVVTAADQSLFAVSRIGD